MKNKNKRLLQSLDLHDEKESTEVRKINGSKFNNGLDTNIEKILLKDKQPTKNFELSDRYDERLKEQEKALSFILNYLKGLEQRMENDRNTKERKLDELKANFNLTM